jgi:hypothetical protein
MKHAQVSRARAWRASTRRQQQRPQGVLSALAFNFCLLLLPIAGATALVIIARDHLYAYEYSDAGARVISERVARLNGDLIQLNFDRQRQWDNLVAMELAAGDTAAARGFLLSAGGILPRRSAAILNQAAAKGANDAELERAALELLTPPTRERYEAMVPLLSNQARQTGLAEPPALADPRDFELMARSLLAEPDAEPVQFVLTGFSLGLAGEFGPRRIRGAAALLMAARRDDYPVGLAAEIQDLLSAAMPIAAFRTAARESARGRDAGAFENASAAFRASVNAEQAVRVREIFDQIGAMAEATSIPAAAALITHAGSLRDIPRLRLIAQSAGDRVAAAAKRLPRDGALLEAARGELTMTRELIIALSVAAAALAALIAIVIMKGVQALLGWWGSWRDDDYGGGELVDLSTSNWRPL